MAARVMHDRIRRPSTWTVHAPHSPRSQDFLGPVKPNSSRNASRSVVRGSTLSVRGEPLTVILTSGRTSLCACAGYVVIFPGYLPKFVGACLAKPMTCQQVVALPILDAPVMTIDRYIKRSSGFLCRLPLRGNRVALRPH